MCSGAQAKGGSNAMPPVNPELLARIQADPKWAAYASGRAVPTVSAAVDGLPPEARLAASLYPLTAVPMAAAEMLAADDLPSAGKAAMGLAPGGAIAKVNKASDIFDYIKSRY